MEPADASIPFRCVLSLRPLIDFWMERSAGSEFFRGCLTEAMRERIAGAPELLEPIEDLEVLDRHRDLVRDLMSAVFPPAFWESEAAGAIVPFCMKPVFVSPQFHRLFIGEDGTIRGRAVLGEDAFVRGRIIKGYLFILREFYGISAALDYPVIRILRDPETGLDRFFRLHLNPHFVRIVPVGRPKVLSDEERARVMANLNDPELLREIIPPEDFEFHGFTVAHAVDVTISEVLSYLERDLIDRESFFSHGGFMRLQDRLRTLFRRPDLNAGLAAVQEDQVLLLSVRCQMTGNCVFSDSQHIPRIEFNGSVYDRAMESGRIQTIPDLQEEPCDTFVEQDLLKEGLRSLLVAPLQYQEGCIGTLLLGSPRPCDLGPVDALLMEQILPVFSMAVKRAMDDVENRIQAIIKEKCTAVHPSVEWRFHKAALRHLESLRMGQPSEMEPIVFRDVYPLYGASDIRGSSEQRNRAIQEDMEEHLSRAMEILRRAHEARPQPILQELGHRIERGLDRIRNGVTSSDEMAVTNFLKKEVEPVFAGMQRLGDGVAEAIGAYYSALDPQLGTVYRRRKAFEDGVSALNRRLSAYLDREEAEAQAMSPHYFEKHQTDGVDYAIYAGESLTEGGGFSELQLQNLRLWQLMTACGMALVTHALQASLAVHLETTHLVLMQHSPLSIRFRFDEKRFDVDGTYDVRHMIIKSRLDKAVLKGNGDRLTQPGRIAVVYANVEEAREARRHIDFLQAQGYLTEELESLELEDLPGVQGLRALRVTVNVSSPRLAQRLESLKQ